MIDLRKIDDWCAVLGLLPVPLFGEEKERRYVLLNGGGGNFCLNLDRADETVSPRDLAWSSDVGQYVHVAKDNVVVHRWDLEGSGEQISLPEVAGRLQQFQRYLEVNQPPREFGIVPHVLESFRTLRSVLGQTATGQDALKAFLCLLACATEKKDRSRLNADRWGLAQDARQVAGSVRDGDWDSLIDVLTSARKYDRLCPVLPLVLRHAAGQLFQEAHYAATSPAASEPFLAGILPPSARVTGAPEGVGVHFTPPALARSIVERAIKTLRRPFPQTMTVYDPACGSGEFLREALRQLHLNGYRGRVLLVGSDTSEAACAMSRFVLAWERRRVRATVIVDIRRENSLAPGNRWPDGVHLLLMNPPFVSWQDMDDRTREGVQHILGSLYRKRPDMASAFVLKASQSLAPDGVLGTVLPASMLDGQSFEPLRAELSTNLRHRLIARLGSHTIFAKAQVDAAVYVGVRGDPDQRPLTLLWADHRVKSFSDALRALRTHGDSPAEGDGYSVYPVSATQVAPAGWAPRPLKAFRLIQRLRSYPTVGAMFEIEQGVLTGLNVATVLPRDEWKRLPAGERKFFRPAIVNASLKDGAISDDFRVFYPYGKGLPELRSEADLERYLPTYFATKLHAYRDRLRDRPSAHASRWWELARPRINRTKRQPEIVSIYVERQPKIVSTYFGRPGCFGFDATGDYVVIQGYAWLPKESWLATRLSLADFNDRFATAYVAVLNAPIIDTLLAGVSNNVGGGQWNLSDRFVTRLPLPDLLAEGVDMGLVGELASIGAAMVHGEAYDRQRHAKLVAGVYGSESTTT